MQIELLGGDLFRGFIIRIAKSYTQSAWLLDIELCALKYFSDKFLVEMLSEGSRTLDFVLRFF